MSSLSTDPTTPLPRRKPSPMMLVSLGLGAVLALSLISTVTYLTSPSTSTTQPQPALVGTTIKPLELPGLRPTDSSQRIPLKNTPTVLVFFASWCGPCHQEMPELVWYVKHRLNSAVTLIGIAANDKAAAARAFLDEHHASFPAVSDEGGTATSTVFGFSSLPETVFIDAKGVVRHVVYGAVTSRDLDTNIALITHS